jgi:hypothetical protein
MLTLNSNLLSRKKVSHYGKIVKMCQFYSDSSRFLCNQLYVLSRAINFGRQCHFKIWLDCHNLKNFPACLRACQQSAKKKRKKLQLMSYNVMIGYDIYDCFTMEHFRLRRRMTLTTKFIARDCTFRFVFSTFFIICNAARFPLSRLFPVHVSLKYESRFCGNKMQAKIFRYAKWKFLV